MEKAKVIKNGNLNLQQINIPDDFDRAKFAAEFLKLSKRVGIFPIDASRPAASQFTLNPVEQKALDESGSKCVKFEFGSGIGVGVYYQDREGNWVDITDYEAW